MKKEKIVITGGLGYIGSELCKLYSGEARFKNIIIIDSKFVSERVKQLRDWGMTFIQGDILDNKFMYSVLHDADVVIHLAGITDVAYVKTESDPAKDKLINDVAIVGTQNVIDNVSKDCKIIFPSTHVVYEGMPTTRFDISEDVSPMPVLTYSKCKVDSEEDLFKSDKSFVILRLASVYGYSTDTMRINIMPNLFSKITSQNGTISLFSGGIQYKSLVAVMDVVRAMKFMAESNYNREIFHVSNESMTIKEVANLCKKINTNVTLIETDHEIPNLGYTISNKKILDTGFKFLYNIENCLTDMIHNWSEKKQPEELEYLVRGEKEFIDERGKISNYELTEPINMIGYIESKAGIVRANHYHPIQEQKCLLIKGKYISVVQDLSEPNMPIETRMVTPGDLAIIKPNVAHTMVFLEDSIFLNLVRGEREHENYGITHTIPYKLVTDKFKDDLISNYKQYCRSCFSVHLKDVISLGLSPLANNLTSSSEEVPEMYPLEMKYCPKCHNCQLSYNVPAGKMFDNYLYVSSTTEKFRKHFEDAAEKYIKEFNLGPSDLVVDIGSNDGIALKPLKANHVKVAGVEPAINISDMANKQGILTYCDYFSNTVVKSIISDHGPATIVTASNVFAHSDTLREMSTNAYDLLKDNGTFIIEVQYLLDTINDLTFDNIYHEHFNYWSVTSLVNFFNVISLPIQKKFYVSHVEHIDTHGGSIRVYVKKGEKNIDSTVEKFLNDEEKSGIKNYETYKNFAKRVKDARTTVINNMKLLKSKYKTIAGYGSPAKATTALNYFGIDNSYIDYIIEDNKMKVGKFLPGVNIPIKDKTEVYKSSPDVIIVMAWNFIDEIKKNNQKLIDDGVTFISIKDLQNIDFPKMINTTKYA